MSVDKTYRGLIIGKSGANVKELHKQFKTQLAFGIFSEVKKKGNEEYTVEKEGLLVTGTRKANKQVKSKIGKMIEESKRDKENNEGPLAKKPKI